MRNRNSSFEVIIKSVDAAVKSNSISEKYTDFLNQCKELGISSYSLNTIIHYAQKSKKYKIPNNDLDKSLLISDSETKQVQEKEKEIVIKEVVKEKWNWTTCIVTALVISVIWLVSCELLKSCNKPKVLFAFDELNQKLGQKDLEIDSLHSSIEQQNKIVNNQKDSLINLAKRYNKMEEVVFWQTDSITNLNSALARAEEDILTMKNQSIEQYPLVINEIEIANTYKGREIETDFGKKIYSQNTMYLMPRIKYVGRKSGYKTLKVRWIDSDGKLRLGDESPNKYFTQSNSFYISEGENILELIGWGNVTKGHWKSGEYRVEIWYEDVCLKAKTFKIY